MGGLLSSHHKKKKKKQYQVSESDRAILDLKNARDRLRKYEARVQIENEALTNQAKELIRANKRDRAKLVLKLRRYRNQRLVQVDDQLLKIEQMVQNIEWESQQMIVVDALKNGNQALNAIHSVMTIESVEQLMDETREAMEKEKQISALLADAPLTTINEDELLNEYNKLELEATTNNVQQQQVEKEEDQIKFPSVPQAIPNHIHPETEREDQISSNRVAAVLATS